MADFKAIPIVTCEKHRSNEWTRKQGQSVRNFDSVCSKKRNTTISGFSAAILYVRRRTFSASVCDQSSHMSDLENMGITFRIRTLPVLKRELQLFPVFWPPCCVSVSDEVGAYRSQVRWNGRPRKLRYSILNYDAVFSRTRVTSTSGLAAAILRFRCRTMSAILRGCYASKFKCRQV